jgi:hypothetical protein
MDIRDLGAAGQLLSGLGAAVIAWMAILARANYRRQVSLEQMKWLQQLYDSFYNSDRYKRVRQLIDFDDAGTLLQLLRKSDITSRELRPAERDQIDQFSDYLNFFEWVGYLVKDRQITFKHVNTMFKYYLVRLIQVDKNQELRKYIKSHGYEELHSFLNRYSRISIE